MGITTDNTNLFNEIQLTTRKQKSQATAGATTTPQSTTAQTTTEQGTGAQTSAVTTAVTQTPTSIFFNSINRGTLASQMLGGIDYSTFINSPMSPELLLQTVGYGAQMQGGSFGMGTSAWGNESLSALQRMFPNTSIVDDGNGQFTAMGKDGKPIRGSYSEVAETLQNQNSQAAG